MIRLMFVLAAALLHVAGSQAAFAQAQARSLEEPPKLFSPQQLLEDFRIARSGLEEGHPGVYRYVTKKTLDRQFDEAEKKLDHPMDAYHFYRILAPMVARIRCGHTNCNLATPDQDAFMKSALVAPFQVKLIGRRAYILRDYANDDGAMVGGEIRAINGRRIERIVADLAAAVTGDGEIPTGRLRKIGEGVVFNIGLGMLLGLKAPYTVTYREKVTGKVKRVEMPGLTPSRLLELSEENYPQDHQRPDHSADLTFMDEGKVALMTIHVFAGFADKLQKQPMADFIKESFELLQKRNTKSLILDFRNNGGGQDELGKLLFSHLTDRSFDYYNDLVINSLHPTFLRYAEGGEALSKDLSDYGLEQLPDGRYRNTHHPNWGLQQPSKPTFTGGVFVLTNGGCFSTTCEFLSIAHFHHRAVFIGEEGGGGYYGNTSGFFWSLTLPNTKAQVHVPGMDYIMAVSGYKYPGRGVMPDYPVQPTMADRLTGHDPEMEVALDLAKRARPSARSRTREAVIE